MTYYVMVENGTTHHYTATVIGWPNCVAEGITREDAVMRVKQRLAERLQQTEIVPIEMEMMPQDAQATLADHPWAKFAGMYQNNPLFDEVLASIQAYRHSLDEDERVL